MHRSIIALAALLLLGAAAPTLAHEDTGAHPLPFVSTSLDVTAAECGEVGEPCYRGDNDGAVGGARPNAGSKPAGWYYWSASSWEEVQAVNFPAPSGHGSASFNVFEHHVASPNRELAALAYALCDLEVLGDGSAPDPLDEAVVEGVAGGSVPDGVFNDGGIGAVCHTPSSFYGLAPYNEDGCDYSNAVALDAVSGEDIWITPSCDATTPAAAAGLLDHLRSLSACIPRSIFDGSAPGGTIDCINTFVACAITGTGCPLTGATFCGADGVADAWEAGQGDGPSLGGSANGVPYPSAPGGCSTDLAAAVFAWNAVIVDVDPLGVTVEAASLATHGWIA